METDNKTKAEKKWYQKWWFWVIVVYAFLCVITGSKDDGAEPQEDNTSVSSSHVSDTSEVEAVEETVSIELIAGEPGEYGELFTINKDTDHEETYYIYHIPAGTYTVTNSGEYMDQFNVYRDEVVVNSDGWEEFAEAIYVKVLDVGVSDTFTFEDGQCIEIHEPAHFILEKIA